MSAAGLVIAEEDPRAADVVALLGIHLAFSRAASPACTDHALDLDGLLDPAVTFFTARRDAGLLAIAALRELDPGHAEIKSMHTAAAARRQGVAQCMVEHLLAVAEARGYRRVSLETGTMEEFAAARALYVAAGFRPCQPFASYTATPHNAYLTIELAPALAGVPTSPGVGMGPVVRPGNGLAGVVVAPDLTPGEVAALDADRAVAVATAAGAPLSHAAILARSRGLPAVTGLGPAVLDLPAGTVVLVDGTAGVVHVAPRPGLVAAARRRDAEAQRRAQEATAGAGAPAVTRDGAAVAVVANVGGPGEVDAAMAAGADGVGMLRTEFVFLDRDTEPGEEEQYRAYRAVAEAVGDRPLVVRTLDLGADIPIWGGAPEPNPALGNRGLRHGLSHPGVLETQLRAVARLAAERPLQVMFPMVTTLDEVRAARACLHGVLAEVGLAAGAVPVGVTVEVPAAALTAEALAPEVDFFAIGTNDLTQYTLAADRSNAAVAGLADGLHPAVLRLIRAVTSAAGDRPVEVVGELATDPAGITLLVGLGVSALSVRPNAVGAVKQVVRDVHAGQARALAEAALAARSAAEVRELCRRAGPAAG